MRSHRRFDVRDINTLVWVAGHVASSRNTSVRPIVHHEDAHVLAKAARVHAGGNVLGCSGPDRGRPEGA